jgi:hypothetical protein
LQLTFGSTGVDDVVPVLPLGPPVPAQLSPQGSAADTSEAENPKNENKRTKLKMIFFVVFMFLALPKLYHNLAKLYDSSQQVSHRLWT